ncbi:hypothetical protein [Nostoc sp. C052]|nr:hypothetical protein [Nostoc sp. C052]
MRKYNLDVAIAFTLLLKIFTEINSDRSGADKHQQNNLKSIIPMN